MAAGVDFQEVVAEAEAEASADLEAAALVVVAPAAAGKQNIIKSINRLLMSTIHSADSLPEMYFLHFSITCIISAGRSESKESLFPVTG